MFLTIVVSRAFIERGCVFSGFGLTRVYKLLPVYVDFWMLYLRDEA